MSLFPALKSMGERGLGAFGGMPNNEFDMKDVCIMMMILSFLFPENLPCNLTPDTPYSSGRFPSVRPPEFTPLTCTASVVFVRSLPSSKLRDFILLTFVS